MKRELPNCDGDWRYDENGNLYDANKDASYEDRIEREGKESLQIDALNASFEDEQEEIPVEEPESENQSSD